MASTTSTPSTVISLFPDQKFGVHKLKSHNTASIISKLFGVSKDPCDLLAGDRAERTSKFEAFHNAFVQDLQQAADESRLIQEDEGGRFLFSLPEFVSSLVLTMSAEREWEFSSTFTPEFLTSALQTSAAKIPEIIETELSMHAASSLFDWLTTGRAVDKEDLANLRSAFTQVYNEQIGTSCITDLIEGDSESDRGGRDMQQMGWSGVRAAALAAADGHFTDVTGTNLEDQNRNQLYDYLTTPTGYKTMLIALAKVAEIGRTHRMVHIGGDLTGPFNDLIATADSAIASQSAATG